MNSFLAAYGKELHMEKNVVVPSLPSNSVAGKTSFSSCFAESNFQHSVFPTKVINKRAHSSNTWVLDTKATDHITCSMKLLTTITAIT